jgi:hypothetical protein
MCCHPQPSSGVVIYNNVATGEVRVEVDDLDDAPNVTVDGAPVVPIKRQRAQKGADSAHAQSETVNRRCRATPKYGSGLPDVEDIELVGLVEDAVGDEGLRDKILAAVADRRREINTLRRRCFSHERKLLAVAQEQAVVSLSKRPTNEIAQRLGLGAAAVSNILRRVRERTAPLFPGEAEMTAPQRRQARERRQRAQIAAGVDPFAHELGEQSLLTRVRADLTGDDASRGEVPTADDGETTYTPTDEEFDALIDFLTESRDRKEDERA